MKPKREYAGFWVRVLAYLLDLLILAVPIGILALVFGEGSLLYDLLGGLTVTAYIIGFWTAFDGQTPGKRLMGIKVVRHSDGGPITLKQALLRYFVGYTLCNLTLGLGFVMVAFRYDKRGLHDLIAGTCVVYDVGLEKS